MKLRSLFLSAAAIMMLAGCSNDEPKTGGDQPTIEGDADMYVSLVFGSKQRAATFDDGEPEESEVRDVTLYFFDANKQLIDDGIPATITSDKLDGSATDNITKVVKVTAYNEVVVKATGVVAVINKVNTFNPAKGDSWENFNKALIVATKDEEVINNASQGFMMTNSTYADANDAEVCIVPVTEANWVETTSQTRPTPVEIYVERVAAKVTLNADNAKLNGEGKPATINVIAWGLNAVNKTYFPVKELDSFLAEYKTLTDWNGITNKFWNGLIGQNEKGENVNIRHRSYWAVDPNYYAADNSNDKFVYPNVKDMNFKSGVTKYLPENTMNYDKEERLYTTSAIIFAQYLPKDLVGVKDQDDKNWYIYKNGNFTAQGLISVIVNKLTTKYYKEQADGSHVTLAATDFEITYGANSENIEINGTVVGKKGTAAVTLKNGVEAFTTTDGKTFVKAEASDVNAALKTAQGTDPNSKIMAYIDGYCYYEVPIRHFYDDEVPLLDGRDIIAPAHLGRYGIVRNHSYELNVNSIMQPGEPIDSDKITPDGTDDKPKTYLIDVTIKVLAWAVRTQNIEL